MAAIGLCTPATVGSVLYVDDDAPPAGDGQSWATAYRFLQDALADADASGGDVTDIRVAQGLYRPDRREANPGGTGRRQETFRLVDGVLLAGGYAGIGAPDPDVRDVSTYVTTFSGDLLGDDGPWEESAPPRSYGENSWHVVKGSGISDTAIIDGITITAGNASGPAGEDDTGGGMFIGEGNPTIRNCRFEKNYATRGGGIDIVCSSLVISESTFEKNVALEAAGAIQCRSVTGVTISKCSFFENRAEHDEFGGGGIVVRRLEPDEVPPCSRSDRGGIYDVVVTGSLFVANHAEYEGGALVTTYDGTTLLSNSTVVGNNAVEAGGGVCTAGGGTTYVENSIIYSNTTEDPRTLEEDKQIFVLNGWGETRVSSSNTEGGLGGIQVFNDGGNVDAPPLFVDPANRNLRLQPGSPCIDAGDNTAVPQGATDLDGTPRILDDPTVPDTGIGDCPIVDMGAYEQPGGTTGCCAADITGPGGVPDDNVDALDFLLMIGQWGSPCAGACEADITGPAAAPDGNVDALDFLLLIGQWASPADCH
jgi:hypothetical protein